jgi:two-component system, chemotaxis family, sensor kinase CheA
MNALHEQFVSEARELVQQAIDDLVAVEREGFTIERIDRLFRTFHTLKGAAGVVELPAMSVTLHAAEDLLAAIHSGRLGITSATIDQALTCLDQVSQWVDEFEAHQSLRADAGQAARMMADRLRGLLPEHAAAKSNRRSPTPGMNSTAPEWALRLIEARRPQISGALGTTPAELFAVSYEPHVGCFFNGEDPLQLMRQIPNLLAFHVEAMETWPPRAELDPYACKLRLQALAVGTDAEISKIFCLVPDQVNIIDVSTDALRPQQSSPRTEGDATRLILAVIDEQRQVLRGSVRGEDFVGRVGAAARVAANALRSGQRADLVERIERAGAAAISEESVAGLASALDVVVESLAQVPASTGDGHADSQVQEVDRTASHGLRVDESKIDALVNLAAELIVAKNGFAHLAKRLEGEIGGHELIRAVRREYGTIERLAGEMHGAVLQLRMVPVSRVFRSFPRLVRDISQRLGKNVRLVTRGETTESDKIIIDRLFEPLLHLVRNSIDHGIETSEQRKAAKKPDTATLTMEASRQSDRFVVQVIDDGGGIDPAMIRRRAGERGLLASDELAALSDQQVTDLIFSAGFSTAAEVSDLSGRGVGLDAVRTAVEQTGGRVSVASRLGAGTEVRLDFPMNIAMSRIMVVETSGQVFGIPMDAVVETTHVSPDRINWFKSNAGFVLRDRIVPICSLARLMDLPERPASGPDSRLVVVTEAGGKITALEVDAVRERLEVVLKPMQGLLANARGYSGTTLMGDGRVLLVLNLKEILP